MGSLSHFVRVLYYSYSYLLLFSLYSVYGERNMMMIMTMMMMMMLLCT